MSVSPVKMRRRWWLFRICDLILSVVPKRRGGGMLVVRMDGIGDMVLFRPFLHYYSRAFNVPQEQITLLGCTSWGDLVDRFFAGYRVIKIDEKRFEKKLFYRLKVSFMLRRQGYDTVVCDSYFRKTLMHDSLVLACQAERRVVAQPYISAKTANEFKWYLARMTTVVETGAHPTHELVRHQRFLEQIMGAPLPETKITLPWTVTTDAICTVPYAVLNFGSNEPGRNWPFDRYIELAHRLIGQGLRVVFVGGRNELKAKARIKAEFDPAHVLDLVGETTLVQLLDIMKRSAVVVSNETGPGHLAFAVGAATVMIYGGGQAVSFMPYPASYCDATARFANHPMDCYHCMWLCDKRGAESDAFPCVAAVTVDQVCQAVLSMPLSPSGV